MNMDTGDHEPEKAPIRFSDDSPFKSLPPPVFNGGKLFLTVTRDVANSVLKVCRICKGKCFVARSEAPADYAASFEVGCKTCQRITPTAHAVKDDGSMQEIITALEDVIRDWNAMNTRSASKANLGIEPEI